MMLCVCQNDADDMVDAADKQVVMDGDRQNKATGKKSKKDDLDNLKKEVEMVIADSLCFLFIVFYS